LSLASRCSSNGCRLRTKQGQRSSLSANSCATVHNMRRYDSAVSLGATLIAIGGYSFRTVGRKGRESDIALALICFIPWEEKVVNQILLRDHIYSHTEKQSQTSFAPSLRSPRGPEHPVPAQKTKPIVSNLVDKGSRSLR
jgi:hypothetical protein